MNFIFNLWWAFTGYIAPITVVGVLLELMVKGFISVISGEWRIGDFFIPFTESNIKAAKDNKLHPDEEWYARFNLKYRLQQIKNRRGDKD